MVFIFPILCILGIFFPNCLKKFPKCKGKGSFPKSQIKSQEAVEGQPTWTECDEAGDYVVPNVLSPRDLVSRPDNMDETVPHMS